MKEWKISRADAGQPLKKFCMKYLTAAPQSFIYKMLRKKNIVLNDKKSDGSDILKEGDIIKFYLSDETIEQFSRGSDEFKNNAAPERKNDPETRITSKKTKKNAGKHDRKSEEKLRDTDILYRDSDYLIINKPAGLLSQKAEAGDYSAIEAVRAYLSRLYPEAEMQDRFALFQPACVNRLDRNTSGILLFGLTVKGAAVLSEMLRDRRVKKEYVAVVKGNARLKGEYVSLFMKDERTNKVTLTDVNTGNRNNLHHDAERNKPQEIRNRFYPIRYDREKDISLVRIELLTGKSHQIRAQLSHLGHPIIGDVKYGGKSPLAKRQLLHAEKIGFPVDERLGPLSGKEIRAELPTDMNRFK